MKTAFLLSCAVVAMASCKETRSSSETKGRSQSELTEASSRVTLTSGDTSVTIQADGKTHLIRELVKLPSGENIHLLGQNKESGQFLQISLNKHPRLGIRLSETRLQIVRGPNGEGFWGMKPPMELRLENAKPAVAMPIADLVVVSGNTSVTLNAARLRELQTTHANRGTRVTAIAQHVTAKQATKVVGYGASNTTLVLTGDLLREAIVKPNRRGKLRLKIHKQTHPGLRDLKRLEVF